MDGDRVGSDNNDNSNSELHYVSPGTNPRHYNVVSFSSEFTYPTAPRPGPYWQETKKSWVSRGDARALKHYKPMIDVLFPSTDPKTMDALFYALTKGRRQFLFREPRDKNDFGFYGPVSFDRDQIYYPDSGDNYKKYNSEDGRTEVNAAMQYLLFHEVQDRQVKYSGTHRSYYQCGLNEMRPWWGIYYEYHMRRLIQNIKENASKSSSDRVSTDDADYMKKMLAEEDEKMLFDENDDHPDPDPFISFKEKLIRLWDDGKGWVNQDPWEFVLEEMRMHLAMTLAAVERSIFHDLPTGMVREDNDDIDLQKMVAFYNAVEGCVLPLAVQHYAVYLLQCVFHPGCSPLGCSQILRDFAERKSAELPPWPSLDSKIKGVTEQLLRDGGKFIRFAAVKAMILQLPHCYDSEIIFSLRMDCRHPERMIYLSEQQRTHVVAVINRTSDSMLRMIAQEEAFCRAWQSTDGEWGQIMSSHLREQKMGKCMMEIDGANDEKEINHLPSHQWIEKWKLDFRRTW